MKRPCVFVKAVSVLALSLFALSTGAQTAYPGKPVRLVLPYSTGGSADTVARLLAPRLQEAWKQTVLVENKPGANAVIGTDFVAKAAPDGHTLLVALTTHVISPSLIKTPFDPVKDFAPVATIAAAELCLAANPDFPANTLPELIALAKAKPGEINYATTQIGGNQHLAAELLGIMTGAKLTAVPYKGGGEALTAVLGGHSQLYLGAISSLIPVVRSGKLKGIAVSGETRNPAIPNVPTFTQGGVPNLDVRLWFGVLAPAGTPKDIVDKIAAQVAAILATADFKEALQKQGLDPLVGGPEQFGALLKTDFARYAQVIKTANIKVEQ
ncbi:MAG: tripartite tricarboxylate transporter substrate binding protein [Betaproteobacteria bacterium]